MASNHKIINSSRTEIRVVMDSGREEHVIQPIGQAVFVKANLLDQPTFHVFVGGIEATSEKVNLWEALTATSTYVYDGARLRHPDDANTFEIRRHLQQTQQQVNQFLN